MNGDIRANCITQIHKHLRAFSFTSVRREGRADKDFVICCLMSTTAYEQSKNCLTGQRNEFTKEEYSNFDSKLFAQLPILALETLCASALVCSFSGQIFELLLGKFDLLFKCRAALGNRNKRLGRNQVSYAKVRTSHSGNFEGLLFLLPPNVTKEFFFRYYL
jgi:hypothetical protein